LNLEQRKQLAHNWATVIDDLLHTHAHVPAERRVALIAKQIDRAMYFAWKDGRKLALWVGERPDGEED